MVSKKLSFRGFNLGKAITLSLYFTACPGPSTPDVSSCTTTSTIPWKVITMPATGRYESEVTWTSKFGFSNTQVGSGVAGGQTASSGLTYIPIEAGQVTTLGVTPNNPSGQLTYSFTEPVPGSPHLGGQVQAINNIGRPATISLGFIEELDTEREYMHPVLTYPNVGNGLSVVGSPARMLSVHVSLNHQEAACDGLSGGIASPAGQPIWEVDLLSLGASTVVRIAQDPATGAFVASNMSADAAPPASLDVQDHLGLRTTPLLGVVAPAIGSGAKARNGGSKDAAAAASVVGTVPSASASCRSGNDYRCECSGPSWPAWWRSD